MHANTRLRDTTQRRSHRECHSPAAKSASGMPHLTGAPSGSPVMLYDAAHCLNGQIEAAFLRARTGLPIRGNRAIDDARLERTNVVVTEAEVVHHAWPIVFDNDIGALNQLLRLLDVLGILQIERHRALVAIERSEVLAIAVGNRRPRAQRIAALRMLDLNDVRAHVREQHAAIRPRGDETLQNSMTLIP